MQQCSRGFFVTFKTDCDMAAQERTPRDWHLEKSVSAGNIISTIVLIITVAAGLSSMASRIAVIETNQAQVNSQILSIMATQGRIDTRQDSSIIALSTEVKDNYKTIDRKLDSLNATIRQLFQKI